MNTTTTTNLEAGRRLKELRRVAAELWSDRDDAHVMSELVGVVKRIRELEVEAGIRPRQPHTRTTRQ